MSDDLQGWMKRKNKGGSGRPARFTLPTLTATFFFSGYLRPASGTWGSLAALPALYLLHIWGSFPLVAVATVAVFFIGWWATAQHVAGAQNHDPSEVVIDEVAGQWLALWPVSAGAWSRGVEVDALWPGWVTAFIAFRLFDILKPWPANRADALSTPFGVMLDDIFAGLYAAMTVIVFAVIFHVFLM